MREREREREKEREIKKTYHTCPHESATSQPLHLVHTMLVNMLVVLQMVTQEHLTIFVHASGDCVS